MILSSNTLASVHTVCVWICAVCFYVHGCLCLCDEWSGARSCSLGGLGSICLSVSCQHCQWLTTSSTHSTSLFITKHVTHMRVHAQTHSHNASFFIMVDVHTGDSPELERREVTDSRREMNGCRKTRTTRISKHSFQSKIYFLLFPLIEHLSTFLIYVLSQSSLRSFLTFPHAVGSGLPTSLDLLSVLFPEVCGCVCVGFTYLGYWPGLASGQSQQTTVSQRGIVGGEKRLLLAATVVVQ